MPPGTPMTEAEAEAKAPAPTTRNTGDFVRRGGPIIPLLVLKVRYPLIPAGKSRKEIDYALTLFMLRQSLRVSEIYFLRDSSVRCGYILWVLRYKAKDGRKETWPQPDEAKDAYLRRACKVRQFARLEAVKNAV